MANLVFVTIMLLPAAVATAQLWSAEPQDFLTAHRSEGFWRKVSSLCCALIAVPYVWPSDVYLVLVAFPVAVFGIVVYVAQRPVHRAAYERRRQTVAREQQVVQVRKEAQEDERLRYQTEQVIEEARQEARRLREDRD